MSNRRAVEWLVLLLGATLAVWSGRYAWRVGGKYGENVNTDPRVRRTVAAGGSLAVTAIDSDGDLLFDTWSFQDGSRLIKMEFDDDQDGTMDRRRYFNADGSVERTESLATGSRKSGSAQ